VTTNALALVDYLFENPFVSSARAQQVLGVSAPTARNTIKTLEGHGILREVTGRSWGRIHRADEIYSVIRGRDG
jgi:Fic family protein